MPVSTVLRVMSIEAVKVAQALLTLDPRKRVSAAAALKMDYFVSEMPQAVLPAK